MFKGHNHNNDFGGILNNVELVYGRKTGPNHAFVVHLDIMYIYQDSGDTGQWRDCC